MAKILAVAAHPDDLDFGCAGSTATWTAAGDEVVYCIVTDGQAGGSDRSVSRSDMATLRRACDDGASAVVVTHDAQLAAWADGVVFLRDGCIVDQTAPAPDLEALLTGKAHR